MEVHVPTHSIFHLPSLLHAVAADTVLAAAQSFALIGYLLTNVTNSVTPNLSSVDGRFPLEEVFGTKHAYLENKTGSETEDDEEGDDDEEDGHDEDDDGDDEEFSGEEGEEGEEEGDPDDDPEANGGAGSGDGDEDEDEDDEDDDDGEDEDEDEEEEEEEETPQPPAKKRK